MLTVQNNKYWQITNDVCLSTTTTTVGSSWFYLQKAHPQSKQQC